MTTFRPQSLAFEDWPEAHQQSWLKAQEYNGPFRPAGRAAHWRPHSVSKTRKGYATWLSWNIQNGHAIADTLPEELVTEASVDAYLTNVEAINHGWTPYNRAQELYDAIRIMTPQQKETDWNWLRIAFENLRLTAIPHRNKVERLKLAWQVEELALSLMEDAETLPKKSYYHGTGVTTLERALLYRDGLALLIMIRRPFRIKNFASISIGKQLLLDEGTGTLSFLASEMKTKRSIEAPLPDHVVIALHRYITHYRQILLTTSGKAKHIKTNALWISRDGTELAEGSLHNVFRRRTEEEFGKPIPPHWFRDIDVTTLTRHSPEDARIASIILGHSDPEVTNRHYNHALHIDAAKRHLDVLSEWQTPSPSP